MPYSDPDERRRVQRESQRRRRARGLTGLTATAGLTPTVVKLPATADGPGLAPDDVLAIVGAALAQAPSDDELSAADRYRVIATLATCWARLHESVNVSRHVEAVRVLTDRRAS